MNKTLHHLLDINSLNANDIQHILTKAQSFIKNNQVVTDCAPLLKNKTLVNLFFENSTRTRCSFELAAKRLGATVLNFETSHSSLSKGETLLDTVANLQAMGVDYFVVRHTQENTAKQIADFVEKNVHVINAGDGCNQHPTQGLLDLLTIQQRKKDFKNLRVVIAGDIKHSRVAGSLITGLNIMAAAEIRVVGPKKLMPPQISAAVYDNFDKALVDADVIVMLRIQQERLPDHLQIGTKKYLEQFGLTAERLKLAKPDAIVMHPGPMNREVEIASEVADGRQSVILQQTRNGVAVRMAVLALMLEK